MPDFGDRNMPGYEPGDNMASHRRQPRARGHRNGLPETRLYVTDQVRAHYAAQGITLGGRAYRGTGRDILTGHLTERQIKEQARDA
jgi:hypothetical protein